MGVAAATHLAAAVLTGVSGPFSTLLILPWTPSKLVILSSRPTVQAYPVPPAHVIPHLCVSLLVDEVYKQQQVQVQLHLWQPTDTSRQLTRCCCCCFAVILHCAAVLLHGCRNLVSILQGLHMKNMWALGARHSRLAIEATMRSCLSHHNQQAQPSMSVTCCLVVYAQLLRQCQVA